MKEKYCGRFISLSLGFVSDLPCTSLFPYCVVTVAEWCCYCGSVCRVLYVTFSRWHPKHRGDPSGSSEPATVMCTTPKGEELLAGFLMGTQTKAYIRSNNKAPGNCKSALHFLVQHKVAEPLFHMPISSPVPTMRVQYWYRSWGPRTWACFIYPCAKTHPDNRTCVTVLNTWPPSWLCMVYLALPDFCLLNDFLFLVKYLFASLV